MARTREHLVTKAELLERSGASYDTILKDIHNRRLSPCRVIGGRSVWLESEVLAYFQNLPRRIYPRNGAPSKRSTVEVAR
jgi:hypothetical protein